MGNTRRAPKLTNALSLLGLAAAGLASQALAQTTPPPKPVAAEVAATQAQATALRDTFVKAAAASGLTCAITPPAIVVEDVPSFGSYDPDTNTLRTSSWSQMPDEKKAVFYQFLGPGTTEAQARQEFEDGVHHWVLVHELGHWWQASRGVTDPGNPYALEYGADRIAAAYWQERDPSVIAHQRPVFQTILKQWPNPVPTGQDVQAFFNANYEKLAPTPAYLWFQARMCTTAFAEKPAPTFVQALEQTVPAR